MQNAIKRYRVPYRKDFDSDESFEAARQARIREIRRDGVKVKLPSMEEIEL
jgi:hypothetical protein